nr:natural killer cell receptor 2B4-like [Misgurnus anguillicaudatus]
MTLNVFVSSGVFGDEVKSVSVMEGDSVTLHTDTKLKRDDRIQWVFGVGPQESLIARVNKASNKISIYADVLDGRFRDRLQLNNQTGDLTITNITTQHTGLYQMIIFSGKQKISYRFNVTVYAHLPVPVINSNSSQCSSSSSSSNCSLLCSVLNVRDVSLSWYKGNSLLSIISVSDLNIRLSLPLEVEYQDTNTYRCVVNNPITNQTQHLNITQLCQMCSDCVCCCHVSEAVIRLVVSALVGVATVAVLVYDITSSRTKQKKRSQTPSDRH